MRFRKKKPSEGLELLDGEFILATVEPGRCSTGQTSSTTCRPPCARSTTTPTATFCRSSRASTALREVYPQGSAWVSVPFPDVLRLFVDGDWDVAVIDPGSTDPREVPRADAEALLDHTGGD